jgi:hypothetical protein
VGVRTNRKGKKKGVGGGGGNGEAGTDFWEDCKIRALGKKGKILGREIFGDG